MNILPEISIDPLDDPFLRESDSQAVQNFVDKGQPIDPAVRARIRARADRVREKCFHRHGFVNMAHLLPRTTDDE